MKSQRPANQRQSLEAPACIETDGSYLLGTSQWCWHEQQLSIHPVRGQVDRLHVELRKAMQAPLAARGAHLQEGADEWQAELGNARPQGRAQVELQHVLLRAQSVWPLQSQDQHVQ